MGGEIGGGGRGEGGAGGSLFSFHVKPSFLRDGGSVGEGIGSLVEFSQNMVEVGFLWGGAGVDSMSGDTKILIKSMILETKNPIRFQLKQ